MLIDTFSRGNMIAVLSNVISIFLKKEDL